MKNENVDQRIREFGKSELFKDVEEAMRLCHEGDRLRAVAKKHARQDAEVLHREITLLLDEVQSITGLSYEHPRFWKVFAIVAARKHRRLQTGDYAQGVAFARGWPDDDGSSNAGFDAVDGQTEDF